MRKKAKWVRSICITVFLLLASGTPVLAMGWLPDPEPTPADSSPPPTAPEPVSLALIGMAASGAGGYYLGRKKKRGKRAEKKRDREMSRN